MNTHTKIKLILILLLSLLFGKIYPQQGPRADYFSDVIIKIDTSKYSLSRNTILFNDENHIAIEYQNNQPVCELRLFAYDFNQIEAIRLHPSGDFEILDSLKIINEEYARVKVKFNNITKSNFLNFTISIIESYTGKISIQEIKILPASKTFIRIYPDDDELYIGEEKIFELITNNADNLKLNTQWTSGEDIDYRFSEKNGQLRIHLLPNVLGRKSLKAKAETFKPFLDKYGQLVFNHPQNFHEFNVKASRLGFLNIDRKEITFVPGTVETTEVQLDNNRLLQLQKTYRIENQEQPGGALIAEIFTRNSLNNNRVLCYLRVYAYHRKSDGYLYIKDGDEAKFITNFSITPNATINKISILRDGGDWNNNLTVRPGEILDVKIEGQGLHKANFHFDGAVKMATDSLIMNENMAVHKIKVPMDINKSKIGIYNNHENTGHNLTVKEFQQPHPLNFVTLNYGDGNKVISGISKSILFDRAISDIAIGFRPELLDTKNKLHGKQYLEIEIRINGPKNELIDMKIIDDIVVCPADNSPRHAFYNDSKCIQTQINLNNYIGRKTYNLDDWSRIQIIVRHKKDRYDGEGYTERAEIILQRHITFDIDVSFPAGLLIFTREFIDDIPTTKISSLNGISMAMIAQLSFFKPNKIAQYQPYRIGAGFIALDAFNFSEAPADRDVGMVILGSLYPAKRDVKLSFPLNLGAGYYLRKEKFFFLIGPGIRIRL